MKRVLLATVVVLFSSPAQAQAQTDFSAIDANLTACLAENGSTPGVDKCNAIATALADRRLNAAYGGLVANLRRPKNSDDAHDDAEILKRLTAAERAWIAFRDAECNYQSTSMLGGTGETNAYGACLYLETKARVKALTGPNAPQNLR